MLPEHMPALEEKEAERFLKQDKKPLTENEKKYLERCREIYKNHPIKWIPINYDNIEIKKLSSSHILSNFDCSLDDDLGCNDFIHTEALLFQREKQGITYLFFSNNKIVGYTTIAMSS